MKKQVVYSKRQRKASRFMMAMRRTANGLIYMKRDWRTNYERNV